ncbi:MAG: NAD(P)-binding protein [Leptolyngbya sp. SIOISBB]|nr:NAD(P)-binding protein [Leptolyngbya sp. SIOISBB]
MNQSKTMEPAVFDTIIVGAGLSGLYAARILSQAGQRVAVLEARDRVGGLTCSEYSEYLGEHVDLGGAWLADAHTRMHALVQEFKVPLIRQFVTGKEVAMDGETRHLGEVGSFPGREAVLPELQTVMAKLERELTDLDIDAPWAHTKADELDAMTFASWMKQNIETPGLHALMTASTNAFFGVRPEEVSCLEAMHLFKTCGDILLMGDTNTGGQSAHMMGSQLVSQGLASTVNGVVSLSSPVRRIIQDDEGVTVECEATTWHGQHLICALPPVMINRLEFEPMLPAYRREFHQRCPMGRYAKAILTYETPFWRNQDLSGVVMSIDNRMTGIFDLGDTESQRGVITVLFGGETSIQLDDATEAERDQIILDLAAKSLGEAARKPVQMVVKQWAAEPWSNGGACSYMTPGTLTTIGDRLWQPCGRIHWAGTHLSKVWRGYMEGACAAGEAAANAVLAA